ncbi:hypothetical protein C4A75_05000 [Brevibacillus laterosporus]|nr:hypothetical protein [Brevibacillus laterosporus]PPA86584.1 hypothetical protein C4A75_05000 [Brevibacillus laterosporus]
MIHGDPPNSSFYCFSGVLLLPYRMKNLPLKTGSVLLAKLLSPNPLLPEKEEELLRNLELFLSL